MNPNPNQERPLLDENGLAITLRHVMAAGKYLKWRNLGIVRIMRNGDPPTFSLMISTKKNPALFSFFETQDPELVRKTQTAIDTVARHLGAKKEF
jgi:hypothetical protein